jgi:hypothetical protein
MTYIFFYENYDIYKTEQLCANLYRLMEMIFIARKINAILVLPNLYFTPRNNELIDKNNELIIDRIELIDLQNILEINHIYNICKCISLTAYFKLIHKNTILISKENDNIPINNNMYFTIYGILKYDIENKVKYSSLNILNHLINLQNFDNIIIHNYNRLGNPVWYHKYQDEYKLIRDSIKFHNKYYNNIDTEIKDTLMVHWRRGDFKLDLEGEEETKEYYKKYNRLNKIDNLLKNIIYRSLENKINKVFLITNATEESELNTISSILKEFNIELKIFKSIKDNNNLNYLLTDISGLITGSKCKYHLHGYGNFDRMSQYGRWMIEEINDDKQIYFIE